MLRFVSNLIAFFLYLDEREEGCPLEHFMWNCDGTCISMDKPCREDCYGNKEKCGNECVEKGANKRECVENGIIKCSWDWQPCNGQCQDNYFVCGSECVKNSMKDFFRECNGECITNEKQCDGECDHEDDSHFQCGTICKQKDDLNKWKTCNGDCDQGYCIYINDLFQKEEYQEDKANNLFHRLSTCCKHINEPCNGECMEGSSSQGWTTDHKHWLCKEQCIDIYTPCDGSCYGDRILCKRTDRCLSLEEKEDFEKVQSCEGK